MVMLDRRHYFVYIHNTNILYHKYSHHAFSVNQTLTGKPQLKSQLYIFLWLNHILFCDQTLCKTQKKSNIVPKELRLRRQLSCQPTESTTVSYRPQPEMSSTVETVKSQHIFVESLIGSMGTSRTTAPCTIVSGTH